ncbi:uroporphyrinogen-III synthase [Roseixanthobacter liquoris]|uniref:uroporphyrinogen-III synthase n=1 Tax=Roseixanthobacter liquoris TaxID=3119921 RepID=UPI00372A20DF
MPLAVRPQRILLTRPEPGAARTRARLEALGHRVVSDPMLRFSETGAPLPRGPFSALAFTSAHGVRALAARPQASALRGLPVFVVGARTGAQARRAGFSHVIEADGNVEALAALLAARLAPGARILHAAGADRAGDLAALLGRHHLPVALCVLYAMVPAQSLAPETREALVQGQIDTALHYSTRSAQTLLHCVAANGVKELLRALRHLCLSPAIAAPLAAAGCTVEIAKAAEEDALLTLL